MAKPSAPETGSKREGSTSPLLVVAGTVVAVLMVTFVIFRVGGDGDLDALGGSLNANLAEPGSAGACGFGTPDSAYSVVVDSEPNPPKAEGTAFHLSVRRDGKPVAGAKVCVTADMPEMQHAGVNKVAKESSSGRYDTELKFVMGGAWKASVTVAEPGKPVVSIPLVVQVTLTED